MRRHPVSTPPSADFYLEPAVTGPARKRGSYNCGRCGLPKKGHVCPSAAADRPHLVNSHLRRALSFADDQIPQEEELAEVAPVLLAGAPEEEEEEVDLECGVFPWTCVVEVLSRLPPKELMRAAVVCKGWKECVGRVWRSAEELRLVVPSRSQIGFVGSVLQKCPGLLRLSLKMESDVDATVLACIAFSCPNLENLEISTSDSVINRVSGDALSRFVADRRCLSSLKVEGCTNLGFLNLCSSSLSTLWLSDLYCISKSAINCPNLRELSLDFTRQENDSTDLTTMVDSLARTCPQLRNIHIASIRLSNETVLALAGVNLKGLRMLSLVLGSKLTDASVASIVSCYTNLELLDLSGSGISDSGIRMICNVFPNSLSRLLLAHCPNITSSGIQFATSQLPLLCLFDCGMSICELSSQDEISDENALQRSEGSSEPSQKMPCRKRQSMNQMLIIKHGRLKKISLWGCSGLDALYVNCPELNDLNLNLCTNLQPERLLLECPNLEEVHASGCQNMLIGAIKNQVLNEFAGENHLPYRRLADSSKRVLVPHSLVQLSPDDEKLKRHRRVPCAIHTN